MTDTAHIKTCRRYFLTHVDHCEHCQDHMTAYDIGLCETGQLFFDEWVASVTAHPSCEHIIGTEATCDPQTLTK
jgi:hypothetical protein